MRSCNSACATDSEQALNRVSIVLALLAVLALLSVAVFSVVLLERGEEGRALMAMDLSRGCSSTTAPLGEPLAADALSNLRIGPDVWNLSYRFRASQSGEVRFVRVYVKTGTGYSSGNGGAIRINLVADDSQTHTPSGRVLASASSSDLLQGPFNRRLRFEHPGTISSGSYYHLVFSNETREPVADFISINNLILFDAKESQLEDMSVLTRRTEHAAWVLRPDLLPIFALEYGTGAMQGQGYIDALSESGRFSVRGAQRVRQRLTHLDSDAIVESVQVRVRNPQASTSDLEIAIEEDSKSIAKSEVQVASQTYRWVHYDFPVPLTLKSGRTYDVILSSRSGIETFPLQGGARYGFVVPTLLREGRYEVNAGDGWSTPRRESQMQFYFCQLLTSGG